MSMNVSSFAADHFTYSLSGQVDVLKDSVEPRLSKNPFLYFVVLNQIFRRTGTLKNSLSGILKVQCFVTLDEIFS